MTVSIAASSRARYNTIFVVLFGRGIRDVNSKPKIMRRDKYALLDLKSDNWFIDAEIVIRARELGWKIGEIPTRIDRNPRRASFEGPGPSSNSPGISHATAFGRGRRPRPSGQKARDQIPETLLELGPRKITELLSKDVATRFRWLAAPHPLPARSARPPRAPSPRG